jgi:hypothetical protein
MYKAILLILLTVPSGAHAQTASWMQCRVDARVMNFLSSVNDREKNRPAQLEVLGIDWEDGTQESDTCNLTVGSTPDAVIYSHSRRALNKLVAGTRIKLEYYVFNSLTPAGDINTSTWTLVTDEASD